MKNKKMIITIFLVLAILLMMQTDIFAFEGHISNLKTGMKDVSEGDSSANNIVGGIDLIFYIIRYIGTGISIIMVLWLGIKYMISSVEEKAEIKKRAIPVVIGSVLIFGTTNLLSILANLVE